MGRTRSAVGSHLTLCANELKEALATLPIASSHSSSPPCLPSLSRPIALMFAFDAVCGLRGSLSSRSFPLVAYGVIGMRRDETEYIPNMRMYPSIPPRCTYHYLCLLSSVPNEGRTLGPCRDVGRHAPCGMEYLRRGIQKGSGQGTKTVVEVKRDQSRRMDG